MGAGVNMFPKRPSKSFRGGNDVTIPDKDFLSLFADLFSLAGYVRSTYRKARWSWRKGYSDNVEFWNNALAGRLPEGKRVNLKSFFVTAWVPTSPGLYFTPKAAEARELACQYYSEDKDEYLPLGKDVMVLGGVGSVRLKSRFVRDDRCHFLSASSTGVSHEGIPLVIEHSRFAGLDLMNDAGGFNAHIQGTLWSLPEEIKLIRWAGGVPKYYLFVDRLDVERPCDPEETLATVAVMYPTSRAPYVAGDAGTHLGQYCNLLAKGWTFCSFDPSGGLEVVRDAAGWLKGYVGRYVDVNAPLVSDFDELYDHFSNPIEFPLRRSRTVLWILLASRPTSIGTDSRSRTARASSWIKPGREFILGQGTSSSAASRSRASLPATSSSSRSMTPRGLQPRSTNSTTASRLWPISRTASSHMCATTSARPRRRSSARIAVGALRGSTRYGSSSSRPGRRLRPWRRERPSSTY